MKCTNSEIRPDKQSSSYTMVFFFGIFFAQIHTVFTYWFVLPTWKLIACFLRSHIDISERREEAIVDYKILWAFLHLHWHSWKWTHWKKKGFRNYTFYSIGKIPKITKATTTKMLCMWHWHWLTKTMITHKDKTITDVTSKYSTGNILLICECAKW